MLADKAKTDARYRAPALEKGLDILELLAARREPASIVAIARELGRSHGELFRMIQVLETRGYIAQAPGADGYMLTDRLFSLSMHQPITASLVEVALPEMRQLATATSQSCHLGLHSRGEMVVVARMESVDQLGFSVRVGYRRPLHETASGITLYAYQPADVQARWETSLGLDAAALKALRKTAAGLRRQGHIARASSYVGGITDISAPVMRGGLAAAALTVPFLSHLIPTTPRDEVIALVCAAAEKISLGLVRADDRV